MAMFSNRVVIYNTQTLCSCVLYPHKTIRYGWHMLVIFYPVVMFFHTSSVFIVVFIV